MSMKAARTEEGGSVRPKGPGCQRGGQQCLPAGIAEIDMACQRSRPALDPHVWPCETRLAAVPAVLTKWRSLEGIVAAEIRFVRPANSLRGPTPAGPNRSRTNRSATWPQPISTPPWLMRARIRDAIADEICPCRARREKARQSASGFPADRYTCGQPAQCRSFISSLVA